MKKRISVILLIIFLFTLPGCSLHTSSQNVNSNYEKQLTQKEKLEDFEYMYTILKENYPYFEVNKRLTGTDWLKNKETYLNMIKSTKDDESFLNALNSILLDLHNGHTDFIPRSFYQSTKKLYERDKTSAAWAKQLNSAKTVERYLGSSSKSEKSENSTPSSADIVRDNVKTALLVKDKVAYLSIHSFNSFNIEGDMKIIKPFLQATHNYKTLIIDIRGNGGGDSNYWSENIVPMLINKPIEDINYLAFRGGSFVEQFIKSRSGSGYEKLDPISNIDAKSLKNIPPELKKDFKYYTRDVSHYTPNEPTGFNGKIFLLVDGAVFSSSDAFAAFAKGTGFATLVGARTGGDGIGIDPALCALPNSGYVFRFPLDMGLTSDGSCNFENKTEPDIKVPAQIGTTPANDECIQAVLKM